jgi:IS6 family transposase
MEKGSNVFKWKHFNAVIILLTVRWYLQYRLSYRDLVEMMSERGISISHTTIMRWVHQYATEIEHKIRPYLKPVNDSWRCDETYIKVKGQWTYLYRAVDSTGKTIDFMLSEKRDAKAAERFFKKALCSDHVQPPRVITVDKNPSYPAAIENLKKNKELPQEIHMRQTKYLNNIIEQDHRFIKKRTNPMLGFKSFLTAEQTLKGIETMHMIRKGQAEYNSTALSTVELINKLFGVIA